jgi:dipeptidyl aminopeptidase/acylaminoacyl peptidase
MTRARSIKAIPFFAHLIATGLLLGAAAAPAQTPAGRVLSADDVYLMKDVGEPRVSPDGAWVAYTVASMDREADKLHSAVWMVSWTGDRDVRLTRGPAPESTPQWSPDGRYLAFLTSRPAEAKTQIWLLDRRGGEAFQLTDVKGEIVDYRWSPDGRRLALILRDGEEDPEGTPGAAAKPAKPIVVDRYSFKEDIEGYLTGPSRRHLYLFELEGRKLEALTAGKDFEEHGPIWSPDGSRIACFRSAVDAPKPTGMSDIVLIETHAGAAPRKLLAVINADRPKLAWSPDGRTLAFLHGFELKYQFYNQDRLAIVPVAGGEPRELTAKLDRNVWQPEFTPDGAALTFFVEDDGRAYLGKIPVGGGPVERLSDGLQVVSDKSSGGGHLAVAAATDSSPTDIYAYDGGRLRRLTRQNDDWLAGVALGAVEDMSFRSKDGTEIHGLLTKPPSFAAGTRYPALLWIHGGPNGQDDHALLFGLYAPQMERQFFAARGYAVLAINYRGSSGRGAAFTRSIFADWGKREVADLLAGVDDAVRKGIADPDRLGVGGWSYGGILTDYVIASDPRFKAAMSGAGSADQIAMYGVDEYVHQYEVELGSPWIKPDLWIAVSYPFFHADRIKTPTLFMGGEKDFNVPIIGSEQMYQALRTVGVPAELVIYPGQYHIFTRPSFIKERLERWGAWFDGRLKSPR